MGDWWGGSGFGELGLCSVRWGVGVVGWGVRLVASRVGIGAGFTSDFGGE